MGLDKPQNAANINSEQPLDKKSLNELLRSFEVNDDNNAKGMLIFSYRINDNYIVQC